MSVHVRTMRYILFCLLSLTLNRNLAFVLDKQNPYSQFKKWNAGLNGTLELEFKTDQPNGLLLYTDDGGTYDFFELKLVNGALRLRYNLGGGAQIITVGSNLNDGHWHKVQVSWAIRVDFFFISFTLYPAHSRVDWGNLVLRHSVPHFPPNSGGIACWVAELNAALCLDTRAKKWKYKCK